MEKLIELVDVYKIYNPGENEVRALDGIDLTIHKGEYAAIIGASGSGKSTMMNILGCLDVPSSGDYLLEGSLVSEMDDRQLSDIRNKKMGFIFQGFNLIPTLNALENVELPLAYRKMPKAQRREISRAALERVGLGRRIHHLPNQMSGGQQQRVAIARAIAARPPIILADEPTGNLDSRSGGDVINILQELSAEGKTIVLITHDPGVAKTAGRVITIADGRIQSDSQAVPEAEKERL